MTKTGQQQTFTRSIAGVAYRVIITPNGDDSWDVMCERYACGSWHVMPAYYSFALNEAAALAQINVVWGVLEVANAMNEELAKA